MQCGLTRGSEASDELRELIRETCRTHDIDILAGHVRPDHVHLLLERAAAPIAESRHAGHQGQGVASLAPGLPALAGEFWGRRLWARGYFVASSGNVSDEVIAKCVEEQDLAAEDTKFKVTE